MEKLYIRTMGCQMNEYDSDKMSDVLKLSHGLTTTTVENEADVLLINTCSIREKAEEKLFHQLYRWKLLKEQNPHLIIGVGGCVASQEGEQILKKAPFVDMIFGPQTLHRLPTMLNNATNKHVSIDISFPEIEKFDNLPQTQTSKVSSYVSIMEGCSKYCSFCVVPYTRGEEISRPYLDIMKEVQHLVLQGVKEIHLLGQNVNAYRGDFEDEIVDLAFLIEMIADITEVERICFTTSHPVEFSDRLIEAYAKVPKLASHLHLPIQSGSDAILAQMKRGHTALEYKHKIKKLREVRPDVVISSDFIIGFPGETNEDFNQTMKIIEEVGFDKSFSFIYSARPGTPASTIVDSTPMEVKKARLQQVQEVINKHTHEISQSMVGTIQEVLVLGVSTKSKKLYGKNSNMRNVHFEGGADLIHQMVRVIIDSASNNSLVGRRVQDRII